MRQKRAGRLREWEDKSEGWGGVELVDQGPGRTVRLRGRGSQSRKGREEERERERKEERERKWEERRERSRGWW